MGRVSDQPQPDPPHADFARSWVRIMRAEGLSKLTLDSGWAFELAPRPSPSTPTAAAHPLTAWPSHTQTLPAPFGLPVAPPDDDDENIAYDAAGPPRTRL